MKILIAYDGSACGDAALDDLRRAGLPAEADVMVLSVADVWLPPPPSPDVAVTDRAFAERVAVARERVRQQAAQAVEEARALARRAGDQLRAYFPDWSIRTEACADSPAWGVIKQADAWGADLIVVGSHGRSALGRFVLGSVSQQVLTEARCSVRIARGQGRDSALPARLVIGLDGSPGAEAAVAAVAARAWRPGSEARLLAVLDATLQARVVEWMAEGDTEPQARLRATVEAAAERLRAAGLAVSPLVKEGDPKRVLVQEADAWGADCIFVGARGLRRLERWLLGSVSSAVAARAPCSVEVVRPGQSS